MKKKILIFIVVLVVIVAAGGGWFWWTQLRTIKGTAVDYIIKQTETGEKIVENRKAGLTFKVPVGWKEEKIDELDGSVIIYSPDTEFIKPRTVPLKTGCLIEIATVYQKMNFEELKKEIDNLHFALGVKSEEFETIKINGREALKNIFDTVDTGKGTTVYIPYKNKLYSFAVYAGPENEKNCLEEFDRFLREVSYK